MAVCEDIVINANEKTEDFNLMAGLSEGVHFGAASRNMLGSTRLLPGMA